MTVSGLFHACNSVGGGSHGDHLVRPRRRVESPGTVGRVSDTRPPSTTADGPSYPGERLGLPEAGPGSVAGWGRRVAALCVDWLASMLTVAAFIGTDVWTGHGAAQWAPMGVFILEATLLTALVGGSFGQLVVRIVVVRVDGKPVNVLQALLRTVLICLVIPPLVFNRDQRGLHDLAAKTVTIRR